MEVEDKLKQAVGMMGEEDMKRAVEGMMMGVLRSRGPALRKRREKKKEEEKKKLNPCRIVTVIVLRSSSS